MIFGALLYNLLNSRQSGIRHQRRQLLM